ncbi:MAG: hypothetical protein ACYC1U_06540 [Candidatus Aquicultorales bacterium]
MDRTQLMLAIYAYLTSGLILYGYIKRNRYWDVLLAGIGVAIVGTSLVLNAFSILAPIARALFNIGTGLAIAVAILLGVRLISGIFKPAHEERRQVRRPPAGRKSEPSEKHDREDRAA